MSSSRRRAAGFTLVEMLVVILIIGILVALLVPSVYYVVRRARLFSITGEVSQLEQAVVEYKRLYGDYPTDFSDVLAIPSNSFNEQTFAQTVTYRHIRKAYPRITTQEMRIVAKYIRDREVTPAEAVVFWLGGMSSNAKQPFTGTGGPLVAIDNANPPNCILRVQERNKPIFTFLENRLNFRTDNNDNILAASFMTRGTTTPYVYFDSRTYNFIYSDGSGNKPGYASFAAPFPDEPGSISVAVAYKSDIPNTNFNPNNSARDAILLDNAFYFANRDTFQIISPGLDGLYGPIVTPSTIFAYDDSNGNTVPLFTMFPSGRAYHPTVRPDPKLPPPSMNTNPPLAKYFDGQEDNLANFSEGRTIEDHQGE